MFLEAVFFRSPIGSLIFTDLMTTLDTKNMNLLAKIFLTLAGVSYPNAGISRLYRWITRDKVKAQRTFLLRKTANLSNTTLPFYLPNLSQQALFHFAHVLG